MADNTTADVFWMCSLLDRIRMLGRYRPAIAPLRGIHDMVSPEIGRHLGQREALFGEAARHYLEVWWSFEGRWGEAIETSSKEWQARWELCTNCFFLLEFCLSGEPRFPISGWIDGFYPARINVTGRDALELPGTFLWVEGQEKWWLEPGFASVQLLPGTDVIQEYAVRFGDAAKGLATRPLSPRRAQIWTAPKEWLFAFDGPRHSLH